MLRLVLVTLVLAGCAEVAGESDTQGAPLVGVDGSVDQADRNCHVVLRDLARNWTGFSWETVGSSWVWQGTIEVSEAALAEGLVPRVVYQSGSDPQWREATATPIPGTPTLGFARFTVRISEGLPGPGMSGTALMNTRIEVVPFLPLGAGGRLFDHNRNPNDLDNYVINSPEFRIWSDPSACTPPVGPNRGKLIFAADFTERREGVVSPGGELTIAYDTNRLQTCRHSQGGNPLWDLTAHVLFEPGGERRDVSVRDQAPTIAVPPTARRAVLWFENTSASGCQAWDSNFGNNYRFDLAVPPQWIGNVKNLIVRDGTDPCDGGGAATGSFAFDTWARQRAAISNLCFEAYQPGLTDHDDPELWQKLDTSVRWRYAGEPAWRSTPVNFDRRVGNNARYATSWRAFDPFRSYHCPEVAPTIVNGAEKIVLEYYLVINGGEVRPAPGAAFAGIFTDDPNPWRAANCD